MKINAIIVKPGFTVIVAFCYICLFRTPAITILKVDGCEDCVQENRLPLRRPGGLAPSHWAILVIFLKKKKNILTPFEYYSAHF